jgi:sugar phosphate isomerase/epimerase
MKQAPDWLGLMCQGRTFEEVDEWLEAAAQFGFKIVQPSFFWSGYSPGDFTLLKQRLDKLGLEAAAFGVYCDIYKWDKPIGAVFESTGADLEVAIRHAAVIGSPHVVSWCGTDGEYGQPCAANRTAGVRQAFTDHLRRIQPLLNETKVKLLFEPWREHILGDEGTTAELCRSHAPVLGAVLDCPNFISTGQWGERLVRIQSIQEQLGPHAGIIHLKDMTVYGPDRFMLPLFGRGDLTVELASAYRPFMGRIPIIAEHMASPDDLPELLESVEMHFG